MEPDGSEKTEDRGFLHPVPRAERLSADLSRGDRKKARSFPKTGGDGDRGIKNTGAKGNLCLRSGGMSSPSDPRQETGKRAGGDYTKPSAGRGRRKDQLHIKKHEALLDGGAEAHPSAPGAVTQAAKRLRGRKPPVYFSGYYTNLSGRSVDGQPERSVCRKHQHQ